MPNQSFLEIDETRLDEEWVDQPVLFYSYAVNLANARRVLDQDKAYLEETKASLSLEIRDDPEHYGLVKITESSIEAVMTSMIQSERTRVRNAKHEVDILAAAVSALDHRKCALENLVTLHSQNCFSTSQSTKDPIRASMEQDDD